MMKRAVRRQKAGTAALAEEVKALKPHTREFRALMVQNTVDSVTNVEYEKIYARVKEENGGKELDYKGILEYIERHHLGLNGARKLKGITLRGYKSAICHALYVRGIFLEPEKSDDLDTVLTGIVCKEGAKVPRAHLTPEQLAKVLAEAERRSKSPLARDRMYLDIAEGIKVLYGIGGRGKDITVLCPARIDLAGDVVWCVRKAWITERTKNGYDEAHDIATEECREILRRRMAPFDQAGRENDSTPLFPLWNPKVVSELIHQVAVANRWPDDRIYCGAHNIRYTVATEMWEAAIEAEKKRLKHTTAASAKHYGDPKRYGAAKPGRTVAAKKEVGTKPRAVKVASATAAATRKAVRAAASGRLKK